MGKGGRLPYLDILAVCSEICPSWRLCPAILFWLGLNLVGGVGLSDVDLVIGCGCVCTRVYARVCTRVCVNGFIFFGAN